MRLGGPTFNTTKTAQAWGEALTQLGYRAAYLPDYAAADPEAFVAEARDRKIVIAEVGAWSNPISPDANKAKEAMELCCSRLALADRVGARCCVNIVGSRSDIWDGPHRDNLSRDTFDLVVRTTRQIIDTVRPTRTVYALETMPWVLPDSPESYVELLKAIDRKQFGVHLDLVNMINCPSRAYDTAGYARHSVKLLAPWLRSVHLKDISLRAQLTVHLEECRPGTGIIDYPALLTALAPIDPDLPVMLEHLPKPEEYDAAAAFIRQTAAKLNLQV